MVILRPEGVRVVPHPFNFGLWSNGMIPGFDPGDVGSNPTRPTIPSRGERSDYRGLRVQAGILLNLISSRNLNVAEGDLIGAQSVLPGAEGDLVSRMPP